PDGCEYGVRRRQRPTRGIVENLGSHVAPRLRAHRNHDNPVWTINGGAWSEERGAWSDAKKKVIRCLDMKAHPLSGGSPITTHFEPFTLDQSLEPPHASFPHSVCADRNRPGCGAEWSGQSRFGCAPAAECAADLCRRSGH